MGGPAYLSEPPFLHLYNGNDDTYLAEQLQGSSELMSRKEPHRLQAAYRWMAILILVPPLKRDKRAWNELEEESQEGFLEEVASQ